MAQLLLTASDLASEKRSQYIQDTFERLLEESSIIPIINENDSVAVEELKFGDNDMLSARVADLIKADLLVLLTSVDGVKDEGGELIASAASVAEVVKHVDGSKGRFSIGGMATKLEAVQYALDHGVETIIANGDAPEGLKDFVKGEGVGTRFRIEKNH